MEGDKPLLNLADTTLNQRHNAENAMAAVLACRHLGIPAETAAEVLKEFTPPGHRCETVRTLDGVLWLNDSKATNLHALEAALKSQNSPVILIAGGKDKGLDYLPLRHMLKEKVRSCVVFGQIADQLQDAFSPVVPTEKAADVADCVAKARARARTGDTVLFSPGTSSFDMVHRLRPARPGLPGRGERPLPPFLTTHQKPTIMKTTKTPDHNPTGRTRPKRKMGTVLRAKLSRYRARVSEFEDDAPSSTVVRWLVVLLLLHLLVIGGVYVRSTWFRNTTETVEMATALPAPPTVSQTPVPAAPPAVLPQAPQAAPAAPVTITQPEQVVDARPNRRPAPAVQEHIPDAAPVAGPARHIVRTGDTWERVARDNQVAVNDLKAVNPRVQRLVSGSTLVIPARPGDKMAPEKTAAAETEPDGVAHIVKKGETLSVIARKYKMNWRSLQKFNKMNDRDVARLKIGQKIMIPKK